MTLNQSHEHKQIKCDTMSSSILNFYSLRFTVDLFLVDFKAYIRRTSNRDTFFFFNNSNVSYMADLTWLNHKAKPYMLISMSDLSTHLLT